jgi:hypothetical protein
VEDVAAAQDLLCGIDVGEGVEADCAVGLVRREGACADLL